MRTPWLRGHWAALLAVAGLLVCQTEDAQAHPHFCGCWTAPVPPGGFMVYDFGPGEYVTNWIWRGHFTFTVSGCPVSEGNYELRLYTGTQGTVEFRDGTMLSTSVGLVDLGTRVLTFKNVIFRP